MKSADSTAALTDRLAAAWPPHQWRDVHVLAAVSGGADSTALLRALAEIKAQVGGAGRLLAGHVNHQLRGEASEADEQWLRQQCGELDIPLTVERASATELSAQRGDGLEEAARASRYRSLTAMAEAAGARFVAVAHTRDDQVETVLFRLLRGSGLRGLAGMPAMRPLSPSVSLVRPLLSLSRADLRAYLNVVGQTYREDQSNRDPRFARNRIREQLLPYLRENFNAEVDDAIARAADNAREAAAVIEALAEDLLAQCQPAAGASAAVQRGGFALSVAPLREQPELLVGEALRHAWRQAGLPEQSMTRAHWRELARFACSPDAGGALNLPGNVRAAHTLPGVLAVAAAGSG